MASPRDIRRRINAAKNIKQITRAMQFVAASKLKRAQDAALSARPYAEKIDEVLADLAAVLGDEDHPLLAQRSGDRRWISPDALATLGVSTFARKTVALGVGGSRGLET